MGVVVWVLKCVWCGWVVGRAAMGAPYVQYLLLFFFPPPLLFPIPSEKNH